MREGQRPGTDLDVRVRTSKMPGTSFSLAAAATATIALSMIRGHGAPRLEDSIIEV